MEKTAALLPGGARPWVVWVMVFLCCLVSGRSVEALRPLKGSQFDPRGAKHMPVGVPNTVDTLKTFVEPEGCFSPGFATYGIYVWAYLPGEGLVAPTMDAVNVTYGLDTKGCLLPWSQWTANAGVRVRTTLAEVEQAYPSGDTGYVVGHRVTVTNSGSAPVKPSVFLVLRPIGPAGGPVNQIDVSTNGSALLVDGHVAVFASTLPSAAGVTAKNDLDIFAATGKVPTDQSAAAPNGLGAGVLRFDLNVEAGASQVLDFIAPVLAGRRAVGHVWTSVPDKNYPSGIRWNDTAVLNPASGGLLQPDVGLADLAGVSVDGIFAQAAKDCAALLSGASLLAPDVRYGQSFTAMINHAALLFNEGTPDVTVINYNTYNRDGMYIASMLQRVGQEALAAAAIATFFAHPFSGRVWPESDNPGELLWIAGEHWLLFQNATWLQTAYPSIKTLPNLIAYERTTPAPHFVSMNTLAYGDACPPSDKNTLEYGSVDGFHPEFSDAFDVAGLRAAALLATAARAPADAQTFSSLADALLTQYQQSKYAFSSKYDYFNFCALWPARLFPLSSGPISDGFKKTGPQKPDTWLYFPLATAHQSLLAGNREAGYQTIDAFLSDPQMTGWFTLDEGGASDQGKWAQVGYHNWNPQTAMPHGWSMAEFWHLVRDSFLHEDGETLVIFGGVNPLWLTSFNKIQVVGWRTHFGSCTISYAPLPTGQGASLDVSSDTCPSGGYVIRLPTSLQLYTGTTRVSPGDNGDFPVGCNSTKLVVSTSDYFN